MCLEMEAGIMIPVITKEIFSQEIQKMVDMGFTHMEAILHFSKENNIEVEVAAKLINNKIKAGVELEARSLNFLPKQAELPLD